MPQIAKQQSFNKLFALISAKQKAILKLNQHGIDSDKDAGMVLLTWKIPPPIAFSMTWVLAAPRKERPTLRRSVTAVHQGRSFSMRIRFHGQLAHSQQPRILVNKLSMHYVCGLCRCLYGTFV